MNLLAITPDQFQAAAVGWIGAIVAVVTTAAIAAAVLLPKLAALKTQVEALMHSRDVQRTDIQANTKAITDIALKTPTSPPTSSTPVNPQP